MSLLDAYAVKRQAEEAAASENDKIARSTNKYEVIDSFNKMLMVLHGQKGATTIVAPGGFGKTHTADCIVSAFNRLNYALPYPVSDDISITLDVFKSILSPTVLESLISKQVVDASAIKGLWRSALAAMNLDKYEVLMSKYPLMCMDSIQAFYRWLENAQHKHAAIPFISYSHEGKVDQEDDFFESEAPLISGSFTSGRSNWAHRGEGCVLKLFKIASSHEFASYINEDGGDLYLPGVRIKFKGAQLNLALVLVPGENSPYLEMVPIEEASTKPIPLASEIYDSGNVGLRALMANKLKEFYEEGEAIVEPFSGHLYFTAFVLDVSELATSLTALSVQKILGFSDSVKLIVGASGAELVTDEILEKPSPIETTPSLLYFPVSDSDVPITLYEEHTEGDYMFSILMEPSEYQKKAAKKKSEEHEDAWEDDDSDDGIPDSVKMSNLYSFLVEHHPITLMHKLVEVGIGELAASLSAANFSVLNQLVKKGLKEVNILKGPSLIFTESKDSFGYTMIATAAHIEEKGVMLKLEHEDEGGGTFFTSHRLSNCTLIACTRAFLLASTVVHVSTLNAMLATEVKVSNSTKTGGIESTDLLVNQALSNNATAVHANLVIETRDDATVKLEKEQADAVAQGIIGANTRNLITIEEGAKIDGFDTRTFRLRIKGGNTSESFFAVLENVPLSGMFPNEVRGSGGSMSATAYIDACDTSLLDSLSMNKGT